MLLRMSKKLNLNKFINLYQMKNSNRLHTSVQNLSIVNPKIEENKINVKGININYLKTGTGKQTVFFSPSLLGSIWTDLKPQIESLDKTKFTIVAWDPPGYGKSRPPERDYSGDFGQRDAEYAYELMNTLGVSKFSLVSWSSSGISSMRIAAKYPQCVDKLILMSCPIQCSFRELETHKTLKNLSTWPEERKAPLLAMYGEEDLSKMWNSWVDTLVHLYENENGTFLKEVIPNVKCPTLILQGNKDNFVLPKNAFILNSSIRNSRVKILEGGHNAHLKYSDEYNKLITEFLLEEN
ncbi:valacyclovir hydrolase-like [Microplitis mediator]|uniref:valacyclovir hydrolase-like n=1 Tax=Microplitis mediator TaxID=375433 RepID=UPI002555C39A|nr:valacyclovir hydrolase-like [Microplitis mediator]